MDAICSFLIDFGKNLLFAFVGVVLALWYENRGAARLTLTPAGFTDGIRESYGRARFLHIAVHNTPKKGPLLTRRTAYHVHGTIAFLDAGGKQVGETVQIRWDGAPEPLKYELNNNGEIVPLLEPSLMRIARFMDIPPDEKESFAIAVRVYDEKKAYGWTNESYRYGWRHREYELPLGDYIAKVELRTGDTVSTHEFPISNREAFESFDLKKPA